MQSRLGKWYCTEPKEFKDPDLGIHVIAKDNAGADREGAKEYIGFDGPLSDVADFVARHNDKFLYETVYTHHRYMIIDLDRTFTPSEAADPASRASARLDTLGAVLTVATDLFRHLTHHPHFLLTPGLNCQLKESAYDKKFSSHLLIYVPELTMAGSRAIALELAKRCFASGSPLLVWVHANGSQRSVVDISIYNDRRKIRLLYNSKLKGGVVAPMTPVGGSSPDIIAHMVTPDLASFTPPAMVPPLHLDHLTPHTPPHPSRPNRRPAAVVTAMGHEVADSDAPRRHPTGVWQPAQLAALKDAIIECTPVAELIGAVRLGNVRIDDDGEGCTIPIIHGPCCPFAKRVHKGNNMFFRYKHRTRHLRLHCHNAECKAAGASFGFRIGFPVEPAVTAAEAVAPPSLHTCEHRIEWAEDYSEPKMRDYPLDASILAVVANMGIGELGNGGNGGNA